MKIGIGLAAAVFVAILSPVAASAATVDKAADAAMAKTRAAGMKEAPAVVLAKGLACTVTDAIYVGLSEGKDAAGKKVSSKVYEVACQEGPGYILGDPTPVPLSCLELSTVVARDTAAGKKSTTPLCKLPANADPVAGMVPLAQKAGISCAINAGRWDGADLGKKMDQYEVGCSDGQSFLMDVPQPGSSTALVSQSCFKTDGADCAFFKKDSAVKAVAAMAAKSGKPCDVSDARWVGAKTAGGEFYEVACAGGKPGFMVETDARGEYKRAIECALAEQIAGGCTMTAVDTGHTEDNAIYNKKAKEIGYSCNVSKYRSLGVTAGNELVEVACSDHADGGFLSIPVDAGGKGESFNCVRAEARSVSCKLTNKSESFAPLSEQMGRKGKACTAEKTRGVGLNANGEEVIEVGCTGGGDYIVVFNKGLNLVGSVMTCDEGAKLGASCALK